MKLGSGGRIFVYVLLFSISLPLAFSEGTLTINSPTYFDEQNNIFDEISYLNNELLSFTFCSDERATNTKATLICQDESAINLTLYQDLSEDNCFYHNIPLSEVTCSNFDLEVEFAEGGKEQKITRTLEERRESKVTSYVVNQDTSSLSALELSYYINVLSNIETTEGENVAAAYERLKDLRSNSNKCWPSNDCDMTTTTEILLNIFKAGFSLDTRVLEDGRIYVEQRTFNNNNSPLTFLIDLDDDIFDNVSLDTNCTLILDDEDEEEYTFSRNEETVQTTVIESLSFSCDRSIEDIDFVLYDVDGQILEEEEYTNSTGFSFTVPQFACVGDRNECSYVDSIHTLITYEDTVEDRGLIEDYIELSVEQESNGETYIDTGNRYEDGGKYLLYKNNEDILDHLKFNQNNEGSWGGGDRNNKIEQTAWAILGIKEQDSDAENIDDGQKWIYFEEPLSGWGSVKKNSLAYLAIREQIKPYIKISGVNVLEEEIQIEVANPSIYNIRDVRVEFGEGIQDSVLFTASLGEIESGDVSTFNASVKPGVKDEATDLVTITGIDINENRVTLLEFPLSVIGKTERFSIPSRNVTNDDEERIVKLNVNAPAQTLFSCNYINPFSANSTAINITQGSVIELNNSNLDSGQFSFTLDCQTEEDQFTVPVVFGIEVVQRTFKADRPEIVMDAYRDVTINIESLSEETQELTIEVTDTYSGILVPTQTEVTLRPETSQRLRFLMGDTSFLDLLEDSQIRGNILITGENYELAIPINKEQIIFDFEDDSGSGGGILSMILWIVGFLFVGFVGLVAYRYYELKIAHKNQQNQQQEGAPQEKHDDEEYIDL